MLSVDFHDIEVMQAADHWDAAGALLAKAARDLEAGGAGCVVLATNTMHRVADAIASAVTIPLIHIADATAEVVTRSDVRRVGLLGTRYTMEQDFYRGRLEEQFGLDVLIPDEVQRALVHRVIYDELVHGKVRPESRGAYRDVIASLVERGAEGVILGCTEIGLLVTADDAPVPVFDTTLLHAERAVEWALA